MNILFLTLAKLNSIESRGIYPDLMRAFIKLGHTPYIVSPIERKYNQPEQLIDDGGAKILYVKTLNIQKTNVFEKGIGALLLEYQYMSAIKRNFKGVKFDLCLYSTPPITFNKVIAWQKKCGARTYLLLKDIFPQNAVDLGMFSKKSPIYWLFRNKEKKLYQLSDTIGCMSPANCEYVIAHNPDVNQRKVEICPNSIEPVSTPKFDAIDKNVLSKYHIPENKTLFIYGGNLGKPQGIDFLIELLDKLKNRTDLHICVVGSGTESWKLKAWHEKNKLGAVTVMSALPKADYDKLVSCADVGMIFLDRRFTIPNFPSRLLSYLENRQPVFLATDSNTDIGKIAEQNHFGVWCASGDIKTAIENIEKLAKSKSLRMELGASGYRYLIDNYTVDKAAQTILNHLDNK